MMWTRIGDSMDEKHYYELKRKVDSIFQRITVQDKEIQAIVLRQEKHEDKITDNIEKLTGLVITVDKKIDVSIAKATGIANTWDVLFKIGPTILFGVVAGWWAYTQNIEQKIIQPYELERNMDDQKR